MPRLQPAARESAGREVRVPLPRGGRRSRRVRRRGRAAHRAPGAHERSCGRRAALRLDEARRGGRFDVRPRVARSDCVDRACRLSGRLEVRGRGPRGCRSRARGVPRCGRSRGRADGLVRLELLRRRRRDGGRRRGRGLVDRGRDCCRRRRHGRLERLLGRRRGRRCRQGRWQRRGAGGEQPERIDVALLVGPETDAEVHVRTGHLSVAGRADGADAFALGDQLASRDRDRAEVRERHRIPVGRIDRDAPARGGHRARERDGPGGGRSHGVTLRSRDVDASVLTGRIRMRVVEGERLDDGASGRPRPRRSGAREDEVREDERGRHDREGETSHSILPW